MYGVGLMPQKISISDETIKRIVTPDLDRAKAWQDELRPQREQFARLYAMDKEAEGIKHLNRDGWSQVVAPLVYESVEGMKVGLDQLFTSPDFFAVKVGEDAEAGERIRKFIRWNIFEAQYGARQVRWWLDSCLKNHYGVLKVFWDEEYREDVREIERVDMDNAQALAELVGQGYEVTKYKEVVGEQAAQDALGSLMLDEWGQPMTQPVLLALENVKAIKETPVFIGPRLLAVDPESFFYTPDSDDIDKCRVVAHRVQKRLEDIKRGEMTGAYRKGSYVKVAEKLSGSGDGLEDVSDYRYDAVGLPSPEVQEQGEELAAVQPSRRVELWEIYTSLDIDKDGLLESVIIHMAHDVVLNIQENPYRRPPFRMARAIESPWRLEGVPYPQSLEQLMLELTQQTRMWNNACGNSVYGNLLTDDQQLADQWTNRQIGEVLLSSGSTIKEQKYEVLRNAPPDPSILKALEMAEGRAERISGVTRYNQGIDANSLNKTATGIQTIASLAQQRQKYMANIIAESWKDTIEDMVQCFKLFGEPHIQYFVGKGNEINVQDYTNDFTIQIELGIGPQEKAQQAAVIKEMIGLSRMAIPAGLMDVGHVGKMIDRIGQLMGIPLEVYHFSDEEMQQKQQEKAMQQQAMMQQQQEMAQRQMQMEMMNEQAKATGQHSAGAPQAA